MKQLFSILIAVLFITGCDKRDEPVVVAKLDDLAREYLFLELSMGRHDAGHVDAYFGVAS